MNDKIKKFVRLDLQHEIKEIKDPMQELSKEDKLKQILDNSFIDIDNKVYEEPPAYLSIKDENNKYTTVFSPANISAITGKAKAKKSFVQSMIISAVVKNSEIDNTLKGSMPNNKRNIILFDTEQSIFHVSRVRKRIKKLTKNQDNHVFVYSLRGLDADVIIDLINYVAENTNNLGMIFIDQVADLAKSINNEEEAVKIIKLLERITKEKEIHICCVIHQNKGDNYASGWLGTQIMKKAETVISVERDKTDKNKSIVKADLTRSIEFQEFTIELLNGIPYIFNPQTPYEYEQHKNDTYLEPVAEVPF